MTILGILSAKGGVGCSVLATNLGCSLTRFGSVALFDLRLNGGVNDLLLNLPGQRTWAELLPVASELKTRHFEIIRRVHPSGLELYAAPENLKFDALESGLSQCIQALRERVDWLILDLPVGVPLLVRVATSRTDEMILVSTADPIALRVAKQLYERLPKGIKENTGIVFNQYTRRHPMKPGSLADAIGVELLATLPFDARAVGYQVNFGKPCVLDPRSGYGRAISAFADRLQQGAKQRGLKTKRVELPEGD